MFYLFRFSKKTLQNYSMLFKENFTEQIAQRKLRTMRCSDLLFCIQMQVWEVRQRPCGYNSVAHLINYCYLCTTSFVKVLFSMNIRFHFMVHYLLNISKQQKKKQFGPQENSNYNIAIELNLQKDVYWSSLNSFRTGIWFSVICFYKT